MGTFHDQLEIFRENAGLSPRALSLRVGRSESWYRKLLDQKGIPRGDVLSSLADALGVTVEDLVASDSTPNDAVVKLRADSSRESQLGPSRQVSEPMPAPDIRSLPRNLPVLGTASGSIFGNVGGAWQLAGDPVDHIRRPPVLAGVTGAYALYVENDSMLPKYEPGDPVYVHPTQPPRGGDDVIIQVLTSEHAEPETFIKRLIRQNGRTVVCRQFNPLQDIEFTLKYVQVLHRVVPYREIMGF